jgi:preprotein translocase subunit SecG
MLGILVGVVFCIVCFMLIVIILLQRGRGGGLSGAFGGAGGHSAFGAKTGDVFTWVTVALTGVFLLLSVIANYVLVPEKYTAAPTPEAKPGVQAPAKVGNKPAAAVKTTPKTTATTQPKK